MKRNNRRTAPISYLAALLLVLFFQTTGLFAAENLRAASGGFTTAIHAVLSAHFEGAAICCAAIN